MVFHLPKITRCCFCIPLRIGSLLIGLFSIIFAYIILALISWFIYRVAVIVERNKEHPNAEHTQEEVEQHAFALYLSFSYAILVFMFYSLISILLVYGAHAKNARYLRIYFKAALFLFVLAVAMIVISCILLGVNTVIPLLIWCFVLFIGTMVVRSTYLEMEEENKPTVYEMQSLHNTRRPSVLYA